MKALEDGAAQQMPAALQGYLDSRASARRRSASGARQLDWQTDVDITPSGAIRVTSFVVSEEPSSPALAQLCDPSRWADEEPVLVREQPAGQVRQAHGAAGLADDRRPRAGTASCSRSSPARVAVFSAVLDIDFQVDEQADSCCVSTSSRDRWTASSRTRGTPTYEGRADDRLPNAAGEVGRLRERPLRGAERHGSVPAELHRQLVARATGSLGCRGPQRLSAPVRACEPAAKQVPAAPSSVARMSPGRRVVILGGGMAGLTAAWRLSGPGWRDDVASITVYQRGGRLGGKGASSRGVHDRIEEHGLHVWMGYYENAFRLLREVYAELDRPTTDPACPIRTIEDAFTPGWSPGRRRPPRRRVVALDRPRRRRRAASRATAPSTRAAGRPPSATSCAVRRGSCRRCSPLLLPRRPSA